MPTVLITGGAGFIGSHLCEKLINQGYQVYCLDNFDDFYPRSQKWLNLSNLLNHPLFTLIEGDVLNTQLLAQLPSFEAVFHLAAKVSVRPSLQEPQAYMTTNINGTLAMLDFCRQRQIKYFVFSSSSSVYGNHSDIPWRESHNCQQPISPYAASKLSAEQVIYTYSYLYDIQAVCLRFFTVFGPRQRPDLVIRKFTEHILADQPIPLFGDGLTYRDYTFIGDIIEGIIKAYHWLKHQNDISFDVFNLGSQTPITLKAMVETLAEVLEKEPVIQYLPLQPGDVLHTYADISKAQENFNYQPSTSFKKGLQAFYKWYKA